MKTISSGILKTSDEIAVIAISEGMHALHPKLIQKAVQELETNGLKVVLPGQKPALIAGNTDEIRARAMELNAAFANPTVKGILIGLGGVSSIEILPWLDYDLISNNPKPICGFSDSTLVLNAIHTQTGLITYYGPMLFSFAANADMNCTWEYFKRALFSGDPFVLKPAAAWSNYDEISITRENPGFTVLQSGNAKGILTGGHLPSLNLLQGTAYFPDLDGAVLIVEICERYGKDTVGKLRQYLNALLLQQHADKLKGLLIGRFYHQDGVSGDELNAFLLSHPLLRNIPIITNLDFGHTTPMITLPIGGEVTIAQDMIRIEAR